MRSALSRFRSDRTAFIGFCVVIAAILLSLGASVFAPAAPDAVDVTNRFASPSSAHLFGTDNLGRDIFSRVLYGGRVSLLSALAVTAAISVIGVIVGLIAGYYGGWFDAILMRVVDVALALPRLVLALAVTGVLGPGLINLVAALIAVGWADYSRVVRALVLGLRERPFVESARAVGAGRTRIIFRHIAPNLLGQVIVLSTLDLGAVLLTLAGLSFLGLGIRPPTPEWGAMLAEGKNFLDRAPQLMLYPGAAIAIVVLGFNLLGDGLRDLLDPRTRRRRA